MAIQTGRTTQKHISFLVKDSTGTLRVIPISGISVVGLQYDEVDMTAFQDAVKGALQGHPDAPIEITFPFDTKASVGGHTVCSGINGLSVPLTLDVQFGMRQAWVAGEPQFGITGVTTAGSEAGYICTSYTVDDSLHGHAKFALYPGSTIPAWGTTAEV